MQNSESFFHHYSAFAAGDKPEQINMLRFI